MVKLNFAHICDMAFLSREGKVNIIGIFKIIYSSKFPSTHPKFSVVTSLTVENERIGEHKEYIKIIRKKDNKEIGPNLEASLKVISEKQELNFIGDIIGIRFEEPGDYIIKIFFDEKEVCSIPLLVKKV